MPECHIQIIIFFGGEPTSRKLQVSVQVALVPLISFHFPETAGEHLSSQLQLQKAPWASRAVPCRVETMCSEADPAAAPLGRNAL